LPGKRLAVTSDDDNDDDDDDGEERPVWNERVQVRNNRSVVDGGFGPLRFPLQFPALTCGRTCRFRPAKSYLVTAPPFSVPRRLGPLGDIRL
jgi:hypothetical protein